MWKRPTKPTTTAVAMVATWINNIWDLHWWLPKIIQVDFFYLLYSNLWQDLGPVHKQSQVNYIELELQFKSISSNFIGWICLQAHFYLAWLCPDPGRGNLEVFAYFGGGGYILGKHLLRDINGGTLLGLFRENTMKIKHASPPPIFSILGALTIEVLWRLLSFSCNILSS